ncbi:MAG: hypothetical protein GYB64_09385, partial [Chloroflexi bacterium]|nr:hypothetical protein [Chloroflexota bacterium]
TYTLRFVLLDERGEPASAPVTAGEVALAGTPRVFSVPDGLTPAAVTFGEVVALRGFALRQAEDTLSVDIAWGAAAQMDTDYTYFVHLFDPATETIVAQIDSMPRAFTYPTSAWVEGEIVTETLTLDLSEVPPGSYRIAIGWYSDAGRLTPADAGGDPLPDGRVILDAVIAHD